MNERGVAVIGGRGRLGSWFVEFFRGHGYDVSSIDVGDQACPKEVVSRNSILIFALPHRIAPSIIKEWGNVVGDDHLVVDLSSVKSRVFEVCVHFSSEVLLLHPMWSPQVKSMSGQTMICCQEKEGYHRKKAENLISLFQSADVRLSYLSVDEHDRIMSFIQVASHGMLVALGLAYSNSGLSIAKLASAESPVYRMISSMIGRMLSHQSELYADIAIENPYGLEALSLVRKAIELVEDLVRAGDNSGYASVIDSLKASWQGAISLAVEDSSVMIEALARTRSSS
jgi:chorismate mutase/prephenate dehydrogenase